MGNRNYPAGVTAALVALSQGTCYKPECNVPTVVISEGIPTLNLQRAHIVSAEPGGPRDIKGYTTEQRNSFANIILLCNPHHLRVDKLTPRDFSRETLHEWKRKREAGGIMALNGLSGLTEISLQKLLVEALEDEVKKIHEAIERLSEHDLEASKLLRGLVSRLDDFQLAGPFLDVDAISLLNDAAQTLQRSVNWDIVQGLSHSTQTLDTMGFPQLVERLELAVDQLPREY